MIRSAARRRGELARRGLRCAESICLSCLCRRAERALRWPSAQLVGSVSREAGGELMDASACSARARLSRRGCGARADKWREISACLARALPVRARCAAPQRRVSPAAARVASAVCGHNLQASRWFANGGRWRAAAIRAKSACGSLTAQRGGCAVNELAPAANRFHQFQLATLVRARTSVEF